MTTTMTPVLAATVLTLLAASPARVSEHPNPPSRPPAATVWAGKTHMFLAEEVLREVMLHGKISIHRSNYILGTVGEKIGDYEIDPQLKNAIWSNPAHFRAGVLGPDVYPDIATGQQIIHPEESHAQTGSVAGHDSWLRHLWNLSRNPATPAQAKSFVAGMMTHAAGDMFGHTFVNHYTGGPFSYEPDRQNAVKHVILDAYVGKRTPRVIAYTGLPLTRNDVSITGLEDFIYKTFINATPGSVLDQTLLRGKHASKSIPRIYSDLRRDLQRDITAYHAQVADYNARAKQHTDAASACKLTDTSCSATWQLAQAAAIEVEKTAFLAANSASVSYKESWRNNIDTGLKALPGYSHRIGLELVYSPDETGGVSKARTIADEYRNLHLIPMSGPPTAVGLVLQTITDVKKAIIPAAVQQVVDDLQRAPLDAILFVAYGITTQDLEQYLAAPQTHFNTEMAKGQGQRTSLVEMNINELKLTDSGYGNPMDLVDYRKVPALYNSVVLTKLLLLSPAALSQLFNDLGFPGQGPDFQIMLGFIRSIDGDNEWHRHGEKMALAYECPVYEQIFMRQTGEKGSTSCADRPRPATGTTAVAGTIETLGSQPTLSSSNLATAGLAGRFAATPAPYALQVGTVQNWAGAVAEVVEIRGKPQLRQKLESEPGETVEQTAFRLEGIAEIAAAINRSGLAPLTFVQTHRMLRAALAALDTNAGGGAPTVPDAVGAANLHLVQQNETLVRNTFTALDAKGAGGGRKKP